MKTITYEEFLRAIEAYKAVTRARFRKLKAGDPSRHDTDYMEDALGAAFKQIGIEMGERPKDDKR